MARYNTRFQARLQSRLQASKIQEPVQTNVKVDASFGPLCGCGRYHQIVTIIPSSTAEDIKILSKKLTEAAGVHGSLAKMEKTYEIFSFLLTHQTLLDSPRFLSVVRTKTIDLRSQVENEKKRAIQQFMNLFSLDLSEAHKKDLLEAQKILLCAKKLEALFIDIEPILASKY